MILSLLAALLLSPADTIPATHVLSSITTPILAGENCAETKIWTPENDEWFHQLIRLNPQAGIVVVGRGITGCHPAGRPVTGMTSSPAARSRSSAL